MHRLSTCACNHLKAARLSFLSGVRFVKLYVTDTSGKNFSMQHCIVNLYRSVSKREKMPSGKLAGAAMMPSAPGDVLWYSIVTVAVSDGRCWRGGGADGRRDSIYLVGGAQLWDLK